MDGHIIRMDPRTILSASSSIAVIARERCVKQSLRWQDEIQQDVERVDATRGLWVETAASSSCIYIDCL